MDGEKVSYEFQRKWRSGGRKWSEFQDKGNCDVPLIISYIFLYIFFFTQQK